ncbi:sigma factor-like helix-turn-helix DNA-binding protein [Virgibacillus kimchii]
MLNLEEIEGKGLSPYETMNSVVEAMQLHMIKGRLSKLLIDDDKMDELFNTLLPSHEQKTKAIELLTVLSKRERQCYLMHTIENMSMGKIAKELNIAKGTVDQYISRAKDKIENQTGGR